MIRAVKKFLAMSSCIISIFMLALLGIIALYCICAMVLTVVVGLWKEAFIVTAIGAVCTIGVFALLDTADWFLNMYRRLNKK